VEEGKDKAAAPWRKERIKLLYRRGRKDKSCCTVEEGKDREANTRNLGPV
jgi:hypothetical protein